MVAMGYCREDIADSLSKMKYDDITATYLLLGRKVAEVRDRHYNNTVHSVTSSSDTSLCLLRWRSMMRCLVLLCMVFVPPAGVSLQHTNEALRPPPPPLNRGGTASKVGEDQQEGTFRWHFKVNHLLFPPAASPSSAALPSRGAQASVQAEVKREVEGQSKKLDTAETGSPLLGNANNANMADILGRRRVVATPTVSSDAGVNGK